MSQHVDEDVLGRVGYADFFFILYKIADRRGADKEITKRKEGRSPLELSCEYAE